MRIPLINGIRSRGETHTPIDNDSPQLSQSTNVTNSKTNLSGLTQKSEQWYGTLSDVCLLGGKGANGYHTLRTLRKSCLFRNLGKTILRYTRYTANVLVALWAIHSTPYSWKLLNNTARYLGKTPKPNTTITPYSPNEEPTFDSFAHNYKGFLEIERTIQDLNLNPRNLDLDHDNVALDNSEEFDLLKQKIIQRQNAKGLANPPQTLAKLDEINFASQLIWGNNGPKVETTKQSHNHNCQAISDILALYLRPDKIQEVKDKIQVVNFNPSLEDFRLDTIVKLGEDIIFVPYEILAGWLTLEELELISQNKSTLSTPIFAYAIEKGLQNYGGIPNWFSSASLTLVTGEDHCTVATRTLSDNDLISILSKAPDIPTKVSTSNPTINDINLTEIDFIGYWTNLINPKRNTVAIEADKLHYLQQSKKALTKFLKPLFEKTTRQNNTQASEEYTQQPKLSKDRLLSPHIYTVKKYDPKSHTVTLLDPNGGEIDLTLKELRENMTYVISQTKNFPDISFESIKRIFLALILLLAINKSGLLVKRAKNAA